MKTIGIRELRQRASVVLREVESGVTFEVTDRGRPVAVLSPMIDKSPLALDVCDDPGTLQDCARIGGNKLLLDVARRLSAPNAIGGPTSAVQSGDSGAAKLHVQWNWANV